MSWRLRVIRKELQHYRELPRELWLDIRPGPRFLSTRPLASLGIICFWLFMLPCCWLVYSTRLIFVAIGVTFSRRPGDWL